VTVSAASAVSTGDGVPASDDRARFETEAIPYMRQMFPTALRLTRDKCDAEDLLQETFARAYLKFHLFRPGTNLRAWLHSIMFRTFCSTCRKRRRRPAESLVSDPYDGPQAGAVQPARSAEAEALDDLGGSPALEALGELPESFRTAIYLADVQGYQYGEIACIMGTPIGTVMSRVYRGHQMLRTKLRGRANQEGTGRSRTAACRPAPRPPGER
jgi:RNA polymerase sigma-70 factor, ECF subfamily